jgi:FixJ family two-component response regulator
MSSSPRKLVLIVDDDPSILKGIQRLLTAKGFDTAVFSSAEALLGSTIRHEADCFLFDIHLSGVSGIQLRTRLAANGCAVPVIFMTALDDEATRREARAAGCIVYLNKPFASDVLMAAIARI